MFKFDKTGRSGGVLQAVRRVIGVSDGINSVIAAVKNIASILAAIGSTSFAILGTSVSAGAIKLPSLPLSEAAFPIRVALFILISAGLGWALGSLIGLMGRLPQELRSMLANLLAVLFAGLVAGTADWLVSGRDARMLVPQVLVMTLIGAAITLRMSAYQFEIARAVRSNADIRERAGVMLTFSMAVVAIIVLLEMGLN